MTTSTIPALHHPARQLGSVQPEDEFLHPPAPSGHYSATETSYFGFSIPEHRIGGEIYLWFHPVLKVMSASVYIWRGIKLSTLACEYINHFHYLPFPEGGISEYAIDAIGLKIKVLEPLARVAVEFSDDDRDVNFSLTLDALMPPAVPAGRNHFAQAMKTAGTLNLQGEKFRIDGYFTRDRSWGQERRENARIIPPMSWMCGVFDGDFAFHAVAFDDPARGPEWAAQYPAITSENCLSWGYLRKDGKTAPLRAVSKLTTREPDGLAPRIFEFELEDADGRALLIRGLVHARMPWQTWQNLNVFFCLTRWECDGKVGWGDVHEMQQNDYVRRFAR